MKRFLLLLLLVALISSSYSQNYRYRQTLVINSISELEVSSVFHVKGDLKVKTKTKTLLLAKDIIKRYSVKLPLNDTIYLYSNQKRMSYCIKVSDDNGNKEKKELFFTPNKWMSLTLKDSEKSIKIIDLTASKKPKKNQESGWGLLFVIMIIIGVIKWFGADPAKRA